MDADRRRLVTGSLDRSVRVTDIRSGQTIHKLLGHKGGVTCLVFEEATLYTGSWDTTIMLWDMVKFNRISVLNGHTNLVSGLQLLPDALVSISHDNDIRFWDRTTHECTKILKIHDGPITSCVIEDEKILITGASDCTIRLTDVKTYEQVLTITCHDPIHRLLLQSGLIIATNHHGKLFFWNRYDGTAEAVIQAHSNSINAIVYHNGHIYTAGDDARIREWNLATLCCMRSLIGCKGRIYQMAATRKYVLTADHSGQVRMWMFYADNLMPDDEEDNDEYTMSKLIHENELGKFLHMKEVVLKSESYV